VSQLLSALSLSNEPAKGIREKRMQVDIVQAVLKAADEWVSAQEAPVAARRSPRKPTPSISPAADRSWQ
jgi:hypothetical protein